MMMRIRRQGLASKSGNVGFRATSLTHSLSLHGHTQETLTHTRNTNTHIRGKERVLGERGECQVWRSGRLGKGRDRDREQGR